MAGFIRISSVLRCATDAGNLMAQSGHQSGLDTVSSGLGIPLPNHALSNK
jgi:hypothetical protein